MKNISYIATGVFITLCISACEVILPFDNESDTDKEGLVINALAVPDQPMEAYITKTYRSSEEPPWTHGYARPENPDTYYYEEYQINNINNLLNVYTGSESLKAEFKRDQLRDAKVEVVVNGTARYTMNYNNEKLCYKCDYKPRSDDEITLQVTRGEKEAQATAQIPTQPHIEIVDTKIEKRSAEGILDGTIYYTGNVVKMKLRIKEPDSQRRYYKLRVRGVGLPSLAMYDSIRVINDFYSSNDLVFRDERLDKKWGGWPIFFSDVFENKAFAGTDYTVDIETFAISRFLMPGYIIELQTLTEDYYRYLKSVMLYRIAASGPFAESVYIHSNSSSGWGILGAVNTDTHYMLWKDGKYEICDKQTFIDEWVNKNQSITSKLTAMTAMPNTTPATP